MIDNEDLLEEDCNDFDDCDDFDEMDDEERREYEEFIKNIRWF